MNNARKQRQIARKRLRQEHEAKAEALAQETVAAITSRNVPPAIIYVAREIVFERWVKERARRA